MENRGEHSLECSYVKESRVSNPICSAPIDSFAAWQAIATMQR